jgi:hypothetical protein
VLQTLPLLFFSLTSNQTTEPMFGFSQQTWTQNYTQAFVKLKTLDTWHILSLSTLFMKHSSICKVKSNKLDVRNYMYFYI